MKLIKTRLCRRRGGENLEHAMLICIKGPEYLSDDILEAVVENYKQVKK